jgi:hypothetical protein
MTSHCDVDLPAVGVHVAAVQLVMILQDMVPGLTGCNFNIMQLFKTHHLMVLCDGASGSVHSCTKRGVRLFMKRNETFKTCVLNAFSVKRCI